MAGYNNTEVKEFADNGLSQAMSLLNRRDFNASIAKSRQVAERIVKSYAEEKNIPYSTFAETIERLYAARAINMTSRDSFHALRLYGNKAANDENCTEDDARNAYYNLNTEIQTWKARNAVSTDRTPVRVERNSIYNSYTRSNSTDRSNQDTDAQRYPQGETRSGDSFVQQTPVRRRRSTSVPSSSSARRRRQDGSTRYSQTTNNSDQGNLDVYSIMRVIIPIIILILIVVILVSLFRGGSGSEDTPTAETTPMETSSTEEVTQPETTTLAETEPVVTEYRITGDNVNIRYAENTDRVYTQLSRGYNIGEVQDVEGTNYAQFTMDGIEVVVSKDYIEPIEASDTGSSVQEEITESTAAEPTTADTTSAET